MRPPGNGLLEKVPKSPPFGGWEHLKAGWEYLKAGWEHLKAGWEHLKAGWEHLKAGWEYLKTAYQLKSCILAKFLQDNELCMSGVYVECSHEDL